MRLDTTFIRLALRVDAERLAAEVAAIPESEWQAHPEGAPGNTALPLVSAHGDPFDPRTNAAMLPTPVLERMPYTRAIMAALGAPVGRARLMRIEAEGSLGVHVDINRYWQDHMRIHVPVVTHPDVLFHCEADTTHMRTGEVWVFDTWRPHSVENPVSFPRIHLVIDTVGSSTLWSMIDAGRVVGIEGSAAGPVVTDLAEPIYEATEPMRVSPPWQQEVLAHGLLDDLRRTDPAAAAGPYGTFVRDFLADWNALWRMFGDRPAAMSKYVECVSAYTARLAELPKVTLLNTSDLQSSLRQLILLSAVSSPDTQAAPEATMVASAPDAPAAPVASGRLDRPVFIVSSPRSGSTLMFETLAKAKGAYSIGGESHEVFERIAALHPSAHEWESNALTAHDVNGDVVHLLEEGFLARVHDRDRKPPVGFNPVRLLEKTPKNALRVPFLAEAFPDGVFVYLHRDPRAVISSMIEAWKSGRFVTYPNLPGWGDKPWSLLLTPGWREWRDLPIEEIAARQWAATTTAVLDALEQLPPDRWCTVRHEDLIADPNGTAHELCERLGFEWDRPVEGSLPHARHMLDAPEPEKWRRNEAQVLAVWPLVEAVAARAESVLAQPPVGPRLSKQAATAPRRVVGATPEALFGSVSTNTFVDLLDKANSSLIVTTYQSGRVVLLRPGHDGSLNTHMRAFPRPMGVAVGGDRIALGVNNSVWTFAHHAGLLSRLEGGPHDRGYVARSLRVTGDISIHEMAFAKNGELWFVNTRFSCLGTFDALHSFVPRWKPPFITAFAAEDRCHLNGMAMVDGVPKYVTALGMTDTAQGWREGKVGGGVVLDIDGGGVVASGLTMPHSPRWHDGKLWVLDSGRGTLCVVDMATGRPEPVAQLPGFTRGLAFIGRYALIGLSKVREHVFAGLPLAEHVREKQCGVWIVDTTTGGIVGFMRFEGAVEEVFDVQLLAGIRFPELLEPTDELTDGSFLLPDVQLAPQRGVS